MEQALIDAVAAQVQAHLAQQPRALLVGRKPAGDFGYLPVSAPPYEAVILGSLTARELLDFPDDVCLRALLEGIPVYLWEDGLEFRKFSATANRTLWSKLLTAQRQLRALGVQPLPRYFSPALSKNGKFTRILTAQEVRRRLQTGAPIEGRLTPLARDILEGST